MEQGIKRTEKLVSALYLLTSFFDEREPMRWRLRHLGGELLARKESRNIVLEILSALTVAKNASLISDTNFDIVNREFSTLLPEGQSLGEIFKAIEEKEPNKAPTMEEKPSLYISSSVVNEPRAREIIKDKFVREPAREPAKEHREPRPEGAVAQKKNSRQTTILNLLKKKKEIMVKDVTPLIPGVSEKTVQRELLSMVLSGILRKEGEKRWSRYSLAE